MSTLPSDGEVRTQRIAGSILYRRWSARRGEWIIFKVVPNR